MSPRARMPPLVSAATPPSLGLDGNVVRWALPALFAAEEELLRLLHQQLLPLRSGQIQTVLIHDHLRELDPLLPGIHGDAVVDPLPQLVLERLVGHSRKLLAELRA